MMSGKRLNPAWTLAILTGLNLFNYLDRFVLSAVLPKLQAELRLGDGTTSWILTAFMIGYFITSPFFGYLGDRFPRKWLIAAGIFIWSLGTILTGFARTFEQLVAYRVLVGVGEASYATISPSLISDNFGPDRRNNALTIFYVAMPVGAALGNIVGGQIAAHYTWRDAFIWAGAPGLLLALVLLPFREPARGQEDHVGEGSTKPKLLDFLHLFRIGKYQLVVLGYTAYTFAVGAFGNYGPSFLVRVHGVPIDKAGTFFGLVLVFAGLLGTFSGGFAATAWQKRNSAGYAWTLGLSVAVAVPIVVMAFLSHQTTVAMACLALSMFLLFLCTGPVNTLIIESVPVNLRSSAMALSIFMIHLFGDLWSSAIVGHLSDAWGLRTAVMILPVALLVCAMLWLALAVRTMREKPDSIPNG
ncbi:MAG TPA: MFS transporter [Verrucomicrobiae bacterium]|jgi:MFS family permease|nr:MFS transporter [Verrucomicrobiae bacterium]